MNKPLSFKFSLLCLGTFLLFAVIYRVVVYQSERTRHNGQEVKRLNTAFRQVKMQDGGVLLEPVSIGLIKTQDYQYLENATSFSIGSQFKIAQDHLHITYTIAGIEPDGMLVNFDEIYGAGRNRSYADGTVKIAWKLPLERKKK